MKKLVIVFSVLMVLVLTGCGESSSSSAASNESGNSSQESNSEKLEWPEKIALGVLPGEEEGELSRGNQILVDDLSEHLGIDVELFVGQDYNAVIEAMRSKKIDLASFGPFSYIIAHERSNAEAFAVKAPSQEEAYYHSWIVVPDESDIQSFEEIEGKTMLFADPASTSGHLFPRAMIVNELGVKNNDIESGFFSNVSFSGSHQNTILAVSKGDTEVAGVCAPCAERVVEAGLVKESDFRIIKKSKPIPSSPMTYRNDLPADLVEEIKSFFYNYDNEEFFAHDDASERYFEIGDSNYDMIRETSEALEMSPEELLK